MYPGVFSVYASVTSLIAEIRRDLTLSRLGGGGGIGVNGILSQAYSGNRNHGYSHDFKPRPQFLFGRVNERISLDFFGFEIYSLKKLAWQFLCGKEKLSITNICI